MHGTQTSATNIILIWSVHVYANEHNIHPCVPQQDQPMCNFASLDIFMA